MSAADDRPLNQSTADRVIQRALQIDAERAEGLTEAQIREIAKELSVSNAAVEQALAEQRATTNRPLPATHAPRPAVKWVSRTTAIFSAVVILALVATFISRLFP
jgi:hypothetical protein